MNDQDGVRSRFSEPGTVPGTRVPSSILQLQTETPFLLSGEGVRFVPNDPESSWKIEGGPGAVGSEDQVPSPLEQEALSFLAGVRTPTPRGLIFLLLK